MKQLADHQIDFFIQQLIKSLQIPLGLNAQAGQVDRGEAQVASAASALPVGVVDVAHYPRAAAHISHLAVVIPRFIVSQVEGSVQKAEIGEKPLGRSADGQLKQVVIGILRVVVNPFFDLENLHGENGGFPVAQTRLCGQQQVAHNHSAFRRGIRAIIHRAEGHLGAGPGIHGVQVVYQGLHGLIGSPVGFRQSGFHRAPMGLLGLR